MTWPDPKTELSAVVMSCNSKVALQCFLDCSCWVCCLTKGLPPDCRLIWMGQTWFKLPVGPHHTSVPFWWKLTSENLEAVIWVVWSCLQKQPPLPFFNQPLCQLFFLNCSRPLWPWRREIYLCKIISLSLPWPVGPDILFEQERHKM